MMVNQLVIKPKLKELGLSIEDLNLDKVSKEVIKRINHLYFEV
ncbi:MAG: hypothetical protein AABX04_07280 [Nanoarchaeota archaeon]